MSILATIFLKLYMFECSAILSKHCFCCFYSIVKLQKQKSDIFQFELYSQKFSQLPAECATAIYSILHNLGIVAILLANTEKP